LKLSVLAIGRRIWYFPQRQPINLPSPMLKPAEIPEFGQKHVETYLTSTGYHCTTHRGHHGIDIEARGEEENLFVHVVTTRASHEPPELSASDSARVLVKAMNLGYDAWLATVRIDGDGELACEIEWKPLNQ
jgi:hypothetical protein